MAETMTPRKLHPVKSIHRPVVDGRGNGRLTRGVLVLSLSLALSASGYAQLLWYGNPASGTGVFKLIGSNCGSPGSVTVVNDAQRGQVFRYYKPASSDRCENHGVTVGGSGYEFQNNTTYYIGWWTKLDNIVNNNAIFQWKVYPSPGPDGLNWPIAIKMVNGRLTMLSRKGNGSAEVFTTWSTPWSANEWHHIALALDISDVRDGGYVELWIDGVKQTFSNGLQRWPCQLMDDDGHSCPKWGIYGATGTDVNSYTDDLKIGYSYNDVKMEGAGPGCDPATASADDGNVAANVLDDNLNTRWSANGDGQWIRFCLGEDPVTVTGVDVAFYKGNERQALFDIQLSDDGESFTTVAANRQSSGTTLQPEHFAVSPQPARYVRLLGHGNNVNAWNSYTEVTINTQAVTTCTAPVTASGDDGNVAANVLDNDLATRWSSSGDGEWIRFCLDNTVSVSGVQIAFYKGNERQGIFDIQVSTNGTSWTTVASNVYSSGTSLALENFTFPAQNARYVRLVGHGNTVNAWNSYTEVAITPGAASMEITGVEEALFTNETATGGSYELVTYPNPSDGKMTVRYRLPARSDVTLLLHNTANNHSTTLIHKRQPAGLHAVTLDVSALPAGVHLVKLICNGNLTTYKIMKQ